LVEIIGLGRANRIELRTADTTSKGPNSLDVLLVALDVIPGDANGPGHRERLNPKHAGGQSLKTRQPPYALFGPLHPKMAGVP
jgi:hypothetical protein